MREQALIIDPRAFIRPPYVVCPVCGADGLGVLHVYADRLVRRCRECLGPANGDQRALVPLPAIRKRVLYLDQFAISNAMYRAFPGLNAEKHAKTASWQEVFRKIQRLVQVQALVCPSSGFHVDEALPFAHADSLQRTWTMLSAGTRFEEASQIEGKQLICCAELWERGASLDVADILRDVVIDPEPHGWTELLQVTVALSFYDGIRTDIATARASLSASLQGLFEH